MKQFLAKINAFLKTETFRIFLIFLAICFAAYVGYLNQTYIGDNYGGRVTTYDQMSFGEFFNDDIIAKQGRHMSITYWLLHAPLSKLGITYFHHQWVFFTIEIIIMAITSTIFYKTFAKVLKTKKLSLPLILITSLIAVNPFICDSLIYLLPSHPQALLFVALSIYFFAKGDKAKNYLFTLLFLTLAISTYQNYYALFIIIALPLALVQNKGKFDKKLVKNVILALVIMALGIGIVLAASKIHCALLHIPSDKGTTIHLSFSWIKGRVHYLLDAYNPVAQNSFYLFPPYLLITIIAASVLSVCFCLAKQGKIKELLFIVCATIFGFYSPIFYGVIADTFYVAPRIMPALFASMSISVFLTMYYYPKLLKNNYFIAGTMAVTAITIYCCSTFINDVQIANRIELAEIKLITQKIAEYEQENNTTVEKIVVYHRGAKNIFYQAHINMVSATNASRDIGAAAWSDVNAITTYSGRHFEREDISEEDYEKYFANMKDDDYAVFDPTVRLKFVDKTMYWAEY